MHDGHFKSIKVKQFCLRSKGSETKDTYSVVRISGILFSCVGFIYCAQVLFCWRGGVGCWFVPSLEREHTVTELLPISYELSRAFRLLAKDEPLERHLERKYFDFFLIIIITTIEGNGLDCRNKEHVCMKINFILQRK